MKATTQKAGKLAGTSVKHILLIALSLTAVFPLYWMIISSFKNESEIFGASLIPLAPTINNYLYAFESMPIWR
ncbi:MAG: carbohydrate ABC transporter permease, partial [Eubacterium sp.]